MEAIDYCSTLRTEVNSWKTKAHDAIGRFDELPAEEMEKLHSSLSELKAVVEEHTARLEDLSKMCPEELITKKPKSESERSAAPRTFWQDLRRSMRYRPHL
jgi:hypothetical protein